MSHNPHKQLPDEVVEKYTATSPRKFRKRPVVIDAMQWRGPEDDHALGQFLSDNGWGGKWCHNSEGEPCINTLESGGGGYHIVSAGDYVIRGVKGEFYACKPDIFFMTYESTDGDKKKVNNFDVLKKMSADSLKLYMGVDLLCAQKVKAGTQVTFGIGGDFTGSILHKELIGCVLLWSKDEFDKVKKELEANSAGT